jgi:hypothetical protein
VEDGNSHDGREEDANRFAEDILNPSERVDELTGLREPEQIVSFASALGIAPGIVVGRLQKMGLHLHWSLANNPKERFQWSEASGGQIAMIRA